MKNNINHVINELLKQIEQRKGSQTIFVLVNHNASHLSFPNIIFNLTYFAIKQRKNKHNDFGCRQKFYVYKVTYMSKENVLKQN